jgi:hypothetical protein
MKRYEHNRNFIVTNAGRYTSASRRNDTAGDRHRLSFIETKKTHFHLLPKFTDRKTFVLMKMWQIFQRKFQDV